METNKIQLRYATLRADKVNEEKRTAQFVISSEDVDSYKTVFRADGWDFSSYNQNPVVAYNHNALDKDPDNIIGTSRVWQEDKLTIAEVTFEDEETNPLAEKIFRKVKNGTLRMASINARIYDYKIGQRDLGEDPEVIYFTRQDLQEWSIVSIGSNPSALKRSKENLQALRSAVQDTDPKPKDGKKDSEEEKRASEFDVFEAQLIVNQNRY